MTNPTTRIIHDGDVLPMVGGPLDGMLRVVNCVLPAINGGLPPDEWSYWSGNALHFYTLDKINRQWTYQEPPHA